MILIWIWVLENWFLAYELWLLIEYGSNRTGLWKQSVVLLERISERDILLLRE